MFSVVEPLGSLGIWWWWRGGSWIFLETGRHFIPPQNSDEKWKRHWESWNMQTSPYFHHRKSLSHFHFHGSEFHLFPPHRRESRKIFPQVGRKKIPISGSHSINSLQLANSIIPIFLFFVFLPRAKVEILEGPCLEILSLARSSFRERSFHSSSIKTLFLQNEHQLGLGYRTGVILGRNQADRQSTQEPSLKVQISEIPSGSA